MAVTQRVTARISFTVLVFVKSKQSARSTGGELAEAVSGISSNYGHRFDSATRISPIFLHGSDLRRPVGHSISKSKGISWFHIFLPRNLTAPSSKLDGIRTVALTSTDFPSA